MLKFGEELLAGTAVTGIVLNIETQLCEARLNGAVIKWHPLASVCERALKARGIDLTPLPPEPVTVTERQAEHKPCAWYRSIKRFYAIAGERGLDCKAEERMRGALSAWLGRHVGSRSELTAAEWGRVGDACKNGALCW